MECCVRKFTIVTGRLIKTQNNRLQGFFKVLRSWHSVNICCLKVTLRWFIIHIPPNKAGVYLSYLVLFLSHGQPKGRDVEYLYIQVKSTTASYAGVLPAGGEIKRLISTPGDTRGFHFLMNNK